jgi:UDP-N-acetylmuramoyl-L-alanyl-D-glutamate--2,6-diaminopimelate ligase
LRDAAEAVPGAVIIGDEEIEVRSMEYHSGLIKPDSLFVAITGFEHDGNDWVDEAIRRGAVAVVTEKQATRPVPQVIVKDARAALADLAAKFYAYSGAGIEIFAVTGTNGKTTSCFLIKNILQAKGSRAGLITSLVYDTGRDQIPASRTTPESLDVFRMLYLMKKNECAGAVIEVSSHALVLQRVKNLDVKVALFTNISRDHLDFHTDMEDYLNAKTRLLDMVADPGKWAVINFDCPEFRPFLDRARCSTMTYSLEDSVADIYLKNYSLRPDGSDLELVTPEGTRSVNFKLTGKYNLYNGLAAGAAAMASGIELDTIVTGLESSTVISGRLERIESKAPFTIFVDYAHTPDALRRTVETLKEIGAGRVLTLFGCGGDRDRGKRPLMGEAVTAISDHAVLTSDNPRSENPQQILNDVKPGFASGATVDVIEDRREAIGHILSLAGKGDIVLLAGKGAEDYQEINGVRYPFSDREIAVENLKKLGYEK